ncbi:hypothetical protein Cni_G08907 [Canna indica]|uniref:Uncharacterized protein n=1 Tax=Canna indica TaxID=4628 RepID=A0AAQ3Q785_9LILI|nr:hypothetical protein Cni_G08907 [Canna indica]
MGDINANSQFEEPSQDGEASVSEMQVQNLSRRLEDLEHSVHYLEDNMMTRLSALEGRVEELNRRWTQRLLLEIPTVSPNPPAMLTAPSGHKKKKKKKQGTLTARRVIRRYQRLVKPSWDNKPLIRRVIKNIEKKKRQQR